MQMRLTETASMEWSELDLQAGLWVIPRHKAKSIARTRCSCPNLAKAGAGAKIEPFIVHDLRRSAASHMARLGIRAEVVDRILNHSSGTIRGVAAVYNRFEYADERRAALAAWASYVTGLLSPAPSNVVALHELKA